MLRGRGLQCFDGGILRGDLRLLISQLTPQLIAVEFKRIAPRVGGADTCVHLAE